MPRKTKRARLTEAQRASGTQFFGNGFSDDVNEYVSDPTYEPTDDEEDIDSPNEGWAFSMFEGEVAEALISGDQHVPQDPDRPVRGRILVRRHEWLWRVCGVHRPHRWYRVAGVCSRQRRRVRVSMC